MTSTDIIKDRFLSLIDDPDLARISLEDAEHLMMNWLRQAISEFPRCKKDLTIVEESEDIFDNESGETTTFTHYYIKDDLDNDEITILSYAMLLAWTEPKIRCWDTVKQHTGTSDFSKLSNANLLLRLNDTQDRSEIKLRRLKARYHSRDMKGLG